MSSSQQEAAEQARARVRRLELRLAELREDERRTMEALGTSRIALRDAVDAESQAELDLASRSQLAQLEEKPLEEVLHMLPTLSDTQTSGLREASRTATSRGPTGSRGPRKPLRRPLRGPEERGPEERGPEERGPEERGPEERGSEERGRPAAQSATWEQGLETFLEETLPTPCTREARNLTFRGWRFRAYAVPTTPETLRPYLNALLQQREWARKLPQHVLDISAVHLSRTSGIVYVLMPYMESWVPPQPSQRLCDTSQWDEASSVISFLMDTLRAGPLPTVVVHGMLVCERISRFGMKTLDPMMHLSIFPTTDTPPDAIVLHNPTHLEVLHAFLRTHVSFVYGTRVPVNGQSTVEHLQHAIHEECLDIVM